jgi:tetratricopeptide (TPR) repeat protein
LAGEYGFEVDVPSLLLTFEGDKLNRRGKTREALEVFEYQLNQNPRSLNALWQLGETYRGMGEFEKARDHYKRFLEIRETDAAMIQRRLNQVERILSSSAAYRIEQEIKRNGIQAGLKKYQAVRSDPKSGLYFEESEFNALGYRLKGAGKIKDAIEIFKLNVELCPESANAYNSLAEAYMSSGDSKKAIRNYQKSLELNPDNNNAKEMLKKLEKR